MLIAPDSEQPGFELPIFSVMGRFTTLQLTEAWGPDECCSITLDSICRGPEIQNCVLDYSPLQSKPHHKCVQLGCGHRFNGMALLMHFAKNCMICPVCRSGIENEKLDYFLSFPGEPWLQTFTNIIQTGEHASITRPAYFEIIRSESELIDVFYFDHNTTY